MGSVVRFGILPVRVENFLPSHRSNWEVDVFSGLAGNL